MLCLSTSHVFACVTCLLSFSWSFSLSFFYALPFHVVGNGGEGAGMRELAVFSPSFLDMYLVSVVRVCSVFV